ncbi:Scr1 family TA system antitoxin-like transcriptional regulator, partial [Streptomyces sp. NPDC051582]|uniref:Scr1 family TA system antitoxin-like transcriptional regulator n=1 Tax=Streptomyces sp. NPDC051582 TaxID=3155167 RepID=UPI00342E6341
QHRPLFIREISPPHEQRSSNAQDPLSTHGLDRLVALMGLARVSVGIVPMTAPTDIWLGHSFSMFDNRIVLIETFSAEMTVSQPREIELYAKAFALLKQSAVYGEPAMSLIRAAIDHFSHQER